MFDSGVGGLTVLHECLVSLPHEDFVYLGDTARFPYGERTQQQLRSYAHELSSVLVQRGAKLVVIACNSATAAAFETVKEELAGTVPVVGVVRPESRLAAEATVTGKVGVIATEATVASGAYERALAEASGGCGPADLGGRAGAGAPDPGRRRGGRGHRGLCRAGVCAASWRPAWTP